MEEISFAIFPRNINKSAKLKRKYMKPTLLYLRNIRLLLPIISTKSAAENKSAKLTLFLLLEKRREKWKPY